MRSHRVLALFLTAAIPALSLAQDKPATQPVPAEVAPQRPIVTLLDPGQAEARRELRFAPAAGAVETMIMRMKMGMSMSVGGQEMPASSLPAQEMTARITVDKVDENGDIHYSMEFVDAKVIADDQTPPPMKAVMDAAMSKLVGIHGNAHVSSRGITLGGKIDGGDNMDAQSRQLLESMNQSLQQLSSPVPEEAVGVGAKWQVVLNPRLGGFTQTVTTVYTLTALSAESAKIDIAMSQTAAEQALESASLPPGTKATIKSVNGSGTGSLEIAFSRITPAASAMTTKTDVAMTIGAEGQVSEMKQTVTNEITVRGTPGEAAAPSK